MSRQLGSRTFLASLIVLAVVAWTAWNGQQTVASDDPPRPLPTEAESPQASPAHDALSVLEVKGRAPKTGYSREQFGQPWRDLDRNGCDQRNDVLRRDLAEVTLKPGTHGCLVLAGVLTSPYSGQRVDFVRGSTTSRAVQIDHIVALSDAWQKGAQQWSAARREEFANDLLVLRATDMSTNAAKSDRDAASWLPPLKSRRCEFVAGQIAVKAKYRLWVTPAERDAMEQVLATCPPDVRQSLPQVVGAVLGRTAA